MPRKKEFNVKEFIAQFDMEHDENGDRLPFIDKAVNEDMGRAEVKIVTFKSLLFVLKQRYGVHTYREMFDCMADEIFSREGEIYEAIHKIKKDNRSMGRRKLPEGQKKISRPIALNDEQYEKVKGKFDKLTYAVLFLQELMEECYKLGVIPANLMEEKLNKYMNMGKK